jgi:Ca-activated chloride channel homolog
MIQFAHPAALWLLTLIIPIVLLYLLKQKRREVEVPSVMLWKQAIEDLRAHTPFQKLRTNLLLLLQILIILLLTAVLAQPYLPKGVRESQKVILVLDASASMKARDIKPDRFHVAKNELGKILDGLSPSHQVMLITLSSRASILETFTTNIDAVKKTLSNIKPQDVAGDWQELLLLLQPLSKTNPRPRIVIASDFSDMPSNLGSEIPFDPLPVGKESQNIGIVRAVLQPLPENPTQQLLFYQLKNFGNRSADVNVGIHSDSGLIDAFHSSIAPQKQEDRTIELNVQQPMLLRIQIENKDVFPLDNDFVLWAKPSVAYAVQMYLKDVFLMKALQALPSVRLQDHAPVIISNRENPSAGIEFLPASADAPSAEVIQWNSSHPVLRFVDAGMWNFAHVQVLRVPDDASVLLETRNGPAGYAIEKNGIRKVVLGFSLSDSNLYLRAGFPVFLQNAIDWISSASKSESIYTSAEHPFEGPIGKHAYVNFADARESNIAPQSPHAVSQYRSGTLSFRHDLSHLFLILLIALIIVEWWVFHQRIHVEA